MQASYRQLAYVRLLEQLTRAGHAQLHSRAQVQQRIAELKRRAKDLGVPAYKYEPAPVVAYFDPSIKRTDATNEGS